MQLVLLISDLPLFLETAIRLCESLNLTKPIQTDPSFCTGASGTAAGFIGEALGQNWGLKQGLRRELVTWQTSTASNAKKTTMSMASLWSSSTVPGYAEWKCDSELMFRSPLAWTLLCILVANMAFPIQDVDHGKLDITDTPKSLGFPGGLFFLIHKGLLPRDALATPSRTPAPRRPIQGSDLKVSKS